MTEFEEFVDGELKDSDVRAGYFASKVWTLELLREEAERQCVRAEKAEAKLQKAQELRDKLEAFHPGVWVGPWVHSLNMKEEMDAILDEGDKDD